MNSDRFIQYLLGETTESSFYHKSTAAGSFPEKVSNDRWKQALFTADFITGYIDNMPLSVLIIEGLQPEHEYSGSRHKPMEPVA